MIKKLLFSLGLILSLTLSVLAAHSSDKEVNARQISIEQKITGLYVGYFSRAADKNGLDFWKDRASLSTNSSDTLKELSAGFAEHPLFVSTYAHLNHRAFVESIYQNTLGNAGDSEGIDFWTEGLKRGLKRSDMVALFIETSLEGDLEKLSLSKEELETAHNRQNFITNKVNVAVKFTNLLSYHTNIEDSNNPENDPAYLASVKIIVDVTEDISTLNTNIAFLESIRYESDPIGRINNKDGSKEQEEEEEDENGIPSLSNSDKTSYLNAINQARSVNQNCGSEGSFPATNSLTWNDKLYKASYEHIQDLVETETFSHTGSGTEFDWTGTKLDKRSTMRERIENYGYEWGAIGENIAAGTSTDTAPKVVQQWLGSDGHCANLMSASFTEVGMAMIYRANSKYTYYWNQNFGKPR